MVGAKFIGGPWDGMEIAIAEVYPFYDIAELEDIGWTDSEAFQPMEPVRHKVVRYHLYDTWPVKYLLEGLK